MDDGQDDLIKIHTILPMAQRWHLAQQEVTFRIPRDMEKWDTDSAADVVRSIMHNSHKDVAHITERRSLKRRRTDEDLHENRGRPHEDVDFILAGTESRTHFRMRRGHTLQRSLERFAEHTGRDYDHLKLFYGDRYVSATATPDDIGLESGEELHVYELIA